MKHKVAIIASIIFWTMVPDALGAPSSRPDSRPSARKSRPARPAVRPAALPPRPAPVKLAVVNLSPTDLASINVSLKMYELMKSMDATIPDEAVRQALAGAPFDMSELVAGNLLEKAKLAFAALKRARAVKLLLKAESYYLREVLVVSASKQIATVWTYLLITQNELGLTDQARLAAEQIYRFSKGKKPDEIPLQVWRKYIRPFRFRQMRTLFVEAPKGSKVYVDFHLIPPPSRPGPFIARVDVGAHHVAVEAPGMKRFYERVAQGRGKASVRAFMARSPVDAHASIRAELLLLKNLAEKERTKKLSALGRKLGLDALLLMAQRGGTLFLRFLEASKGSFLDKPLVVELPLKPSTSKPLITWLKGVEKARADLLAPKPPKKIEPIASARKAARKVTAEKKPLKKRPKKKAKPLWKKWYFWVAAVAVAVVVTVFAVRKDEGNKVELTVYRK